MLLATAIARVVERHPDARHRAAVVLDDPAAELVHLSAGAPRRGGIARPRTEQEHPDRTDRNLARTPAACPLVVVPDFNPGIVRQGVLVGVPITDDPGAVLDFAFAYASVHDLPLSVMHASREAALKSRDHRRRLAEAMSCNGGAVSRRYRQALLAPDRPAATLRRLAERMNLLVVGMHRHGLRGAPFGHVRSSVVDRSPCSDCRRPAHVPQAA